MGALRVPEVPIPPSPPGPLVSVGFLPESSTSHGAKGFYVLRPKGAPVQGPFSSEREALAHALAHGFEVQ